MPHHITVVLRDGFCPSSLPFLLPYVAKPYCHDGVVARWTSANSDKPWERPSWPRMASPISNHRYMNAFSCMTLTLHTAQYSSAREHCHLLLQHRIHFSSAEPGTAEAEGNTRDGASRSKQGAATASRCHARWIVTFDTARLFNADGVLNRGLLHNRNFHATTQQRQDDTPAPSFHCIDD